ncbi:MAG: sulfite exporter TauE/SafE family protein [Fimbriimonadaceae bacterium]
MTPVEILSIGGSVLVGLALGATGAGGAILLVPLLTYGLSVPAERAAGQSSVVLGCIGAAGAVASLRRSEVSVPDFWRYLPGVVIGAYLGRAWLVEALPRSLSLGGQAWPRGSYLMLCLAVVMVAAGAQMLRPRSEPDRPPRPWIGVVAGLVVGVLTGLLGAGGGFLLVPALVLASQLQPRIAAGTSLGLVACGTAVAGATELARHGDLVSWPNLAMVGVGAGLGMAVGMAVRSKAPTGALRTVMAALILVVALGIAVAEVLPRIGP